MAYKKLVHSVLEDAFAAWDSASDIAVSQLEAVQRRESRFTCGIMKTSTTGLLQKLNLKSLRRNRRLKVFSQYLHSSKTAINNYVRRKGFPRLQITCGSTSFHIPTLSTTNSLFLFILPKTGMFCPWAVHSLFRRVCSHKAFYIVADRKHITN